MRNKKMIESSTWQNIQSQKGKENKSFTTIFFSWIMRVCEIYMKIIYMAKECFIWKVTLKKILTLMKILKSYAPLLRLFFIFYTIPSTLKVVISWEVLANKKENIFETSPTNTLSYAQYFLEISSIIWKTGS